MKRKLPAQPERFKARCELIIDRCRNKDTVVMMRVAPIAKMQCQMVVEAYHGGKLRAGLALLKEAVNEFRQNVDWSFCLWVTDTVGWTRVRDVPGTDEFRGYKMRHGRRCSGSPNCANLNCIEDSIPRWFKIISGRFDDR